MLSKDEIISVVASELSLADSSSYNSVGNVGLEEGLKLYLGLPDGREVEGRSSVISTDVADAIEWILPQIMKSFTQNNEIVTFDAVSEGDEKQSELESQYVYEVLMKQNDGFIILHQFVKDALIQRNGILKVYYAEHIDHKVRDYTGISLEQVQQLLATEGIEILEKSDYIDQGLTQNKQEQMGMQIQQVMGQVQQMAQQNPQGAQQMAGQLEMMQAEAQRPVMVCDIKVSSERRKGQVYVDPVPPEEFRLNAQHNSICLDDARFTAHVVLKSVSDIIEQYGLTKEDVDELPEGSSFYDREYRFSMQDESTFYDRVDSGDESQRLIEISECFLKLDVDQVGIAKLMKVTVAGGDSPTDLISIEEVETMPWVSTTAFLMSHKFMGRSITDRLKQIQDQKTTLWRNILDNMYLQNNQRNIVVEGQVNIDDLLVSRPGGIIRAKRTDAIVPLVTPPIGQDAYLMMDYLDKVRAGRTGVDPDGTASPDNIGDRVGSEGVARLMNAKEELVGLIIRVIAETGIKPLCVKIRDLSVKHVDAVHDFKYRGIWHQINPSKWEDRVSTTVRIGTGSGNHAMQVQALSQVMSIQGQLKQDPGTMLVPEQKIYDTLDDFCRFNSLNSADKYFLDPSSPQGQQARQALDAQQQQQTEEMKKKEEEMMALQKKLGDAETKKAEAAQLNVMMKGQVDNMKNQLTFQKQSMDMQIDSLKQQLDQNKLVLDQAAKEGQIEVQKYQIDSNVAMELTKLEMESEMQEDKNFADNKATAANG